MMMIFAFLLFNPTSEFSANAVYQLSNIFVSLDRNQFKIAEESGLVAQDVESAVEGFEVGELFGGVSR
jgi:hypothetical protein